MNNKSLVIRGICESPYIDKFILSLKDNKELFSLSNFKPPFEVEKGKYQSPVWEGLSILISYSKKPELDNDEVNDFVIFLLNSVVDLLINDSEVDYHKQLSGNYSVMYLLFTLVSSKKIYLDKVNVNSFIDAYMSNPLQDKGVVLYVMDNYSGNYIENGNLTYYIFHSYLTNSDDNEYFNYLLDSRIHSYIQAYPNLYFESSKTWLENANIYFFRMGSVEEFSSDDDYSVAKESVYLDWFKNSSKYIDVETINKCIIEFLNSNKRILKKIAVYLISTHYEDIRSYLYDNLSVIVSNHSLYSDFRCLIESNIMQMSKDEILTIFETVKATKIDKVNDYVEKILKNRIYIILNSSPEFNCPINIESAKEKEFVDNYNKMIVTSNLSFDDEISSCSEDIKNLSVEQMLEMINNKQITSYLREALVHAVASYLVDNKIDLVGYIDQIPDDLSIMVLNRYLDASAFESSYAFVRLLIEETIIDTSLMRSILHTIQVLIEHNYDNITDLVVSIDYKKIKLPELQSNHNYHSLVNVVINENIFCYYEILFHLSLKQRELKEILYESIEFYKQSNCIWLLNSVLAYNFPKLIVLDADYAKRNITCIFDNVVKGVNLSFCMFSFNHIMSIDALQEVLDLDSLYSFFLEPNLETESNIEYKNVLMRQVISYYLKTGLKFEKVKFVISNNYNNGAKLVYIQLKEAFINREVCLVQRANELIDFLCSSNLNDNLPNGYNYNGLFNSIIELLLLYNNEQLWSLLVKLTDKLNSYFSPKLIKLINLYYENQDVEIKHVLSRLIHKYEKYRFNDDILIGIFKTLTKSEKYKDEVKKWRVYLTQRNPDLQL